MQSRYEIANERHPIDLLYSRHCSFLCGKRVLVLMPYLHAHAMCARVHTMHGNTRKEFTAPFTYHCSTV
jgi:hypothetical protein